MFIIYIHGNGETIVDDNQTNVATCQVSYNARHMSNLIDATAFGTNFFYTGFPSLAAPDPKK